MSKFFGVDTSNYTTSVALLDTDTMEVLQEKKLLPVKKGEKGIRQSDAVFHHTVQLPELVEKLFSQVGDKRFSGVGVSYAPRLVEGSYMPCFTVGDGFARSLCATMNMKPDRTSHQVGHILAGIYSCGKFDLLTSEKLFLAFHASGGTTDLLLCRPDRDNIISVEQVGRSLDLKAGQAVDRVGVMLGMEFPCGKELDKLACESQKEYKPKVVLKGTDCCLSGLENLCEKMYKNGEKYEDIAKFCLSFLSRTFEVMIENAFSEYGRIPLLCVGGVMSDSLIRENLSEKFGAYFARPEFSCDNATGLAVYSALKKGLI